MSEMPEITCEVVRLGSRCQMVLPARIRKELGLAEGDELLVAKVGNTVILTPKPKSFADRLLGLHREVWEGVDPDHYVEEERKQWGG